MILAALDLPVEVPPRYAWNAPRSRQRVTGEQGGVELSCLISVAWGRGS